MDIHLIARTLHIGAGVGAFVAGLCAALLPKFGTSAKWHRWVGRAYGGCMVVSTGLSIPLAIRMHSTVLLVIGVLSFIAVLVGWRSIRTHRSVEHETVPPHNRRALLARHIILMGSSYVAAWTAFLLNNPVMGNGMAWQRWAYMFGPTAVGTVFIARASRRVRKRG